jgi:hypothetical protein
MYYVYIHKIKQNGEVVYVGKGSNFRYKDYNSRSCEHQKMMKCNQLDYVILKYFDDEKEAYDYEEKVTEEYKRIGLCKFNKSIGRKTCEHTKVKLSNILKGKRKNELTRERMRKNHKRPLAKKVVMYKDGKQIKTFRSSREAGRYAAENGICSYGWCGRSLKTGEETKPTKNFPIGGFLFVYEDDKMSTRKSNKFIS